MDFRRKAEIEFNEATRLRSQLTELEYREEVVLKVKLQDFASFVMLCCPGELAPRISGRHGA